MKKNLSKCRDCGDDTCILIQISSTPEVILLCNDCYNGEYSKKVQNIIDYNNEKNNKKTKVKKADQIFTA